MFKLRIKKEKDIKQKGITLIALIVTIIVLLILAGVTIATLTGENGLLTRANDAKVITEISALKEDIDVYVVGKELNNVEGIERYPIIKDETMASIDKDLLNIELKQKMSKWANTAQNGEIATIDTIDYSKFYKIDKEEVETAKAFEGDLYLIEVEGEYKVISINEVVYQKEEINIIIPLDDIAEPEYITVGNNTYKWYGNGDLAVIGELNANSGITSEENTNINGLQEFKLQEIAKGTDMAFNSDVETEQNIAKVNAVKKIYFNTGTAYIIDANDDLWACGANADGVLGQGNNNTYYNFVEIKIDGLDLNSTKIELYPTAGDTQQYSSLILKCNDGRVYGWGYNTYGILGEGYKLGGVYPNPMKLNLSNVRTMSLGDGFAIFGTYVGEVYGIGKNDYGQLGTGDNTGASTFVRCEELER